MINQQMPLSSLQLIMQLAQSNPDLMAQMMARTGAQPPQVPAGAGKPGEDQMAQAQAALPSGMAPQPTPATIPAPAPTVPGAALAGSVQPTIAPGPETLPAPGAPSPMQATGSIGDGSLAQMMQMLMQAQQRPVERLSLGRAISGA